ncbi:hypothetical protein DesLBE_3769 [Desulfitobacterium sp. LBE]|nr:hypothetical protein DesLBE_3769 [Desulfitobacterium sp. LBE]
MTENVKASFSFVANRFRYFFSFYLTQAEPYDSKMLLCTKTAKTKILSTLRVLLLADLLIKLNILQIHV